MHELATLQRRLRLLEIDDDVRVSIKKIHPVLHANLDSIIDSFYKHLASFPECKTLFDKTDSLLTLPKRQRLHWLDLFSCRFDEAYAKRALAVGRAHFQHGVAPYLYISGYTFFHCWILRAISESHAGAGDLPSLLTATTRIIHLDMDLALSAYTREYWAGRSAAE